MIDAHPALEGRLAAGPGGRLVLRRLPAQRGVLPGSCLSLAGEQRRRAAEADDRQAAAGRSIRRPTATSCFSKPATMENVNKHAHQGRGAVLERDDAAPQPRRVLAEAGDPAASEERRPGRDGRHRLVRRRGPVRLVQDVSGDREAEPQASTTSWSSARGITAAGRRGDGDKLGSANFGSKTAAFYRAEIELPFFEKYLKDEKTAGAGRSDRVRNRLERLADVRRLAAERTQSRSNSSCATAASSTSTAAEPAARTTASTNMSAIRPSRSRSPRRSRRRCRSSTWSTISGSPPAGPMCWSIRPSR